MQLYTLVSTFYTLRILQVTNKSVTHNMEAIRESVAQMSQMFQSKLAEFEERQKKIVSPTSSEASTLEEEFATFKAFTLSALRSLQAQVELIARETDNLEMHSRRKILLLHGIPDSKNEDTAAVIVKTVVEKLKLSSFQTADISRCHRMGRLSSGDRARPILFKVRDVTVRANIWAAKTSLKGSGITLSEFLTKARHDTFMAARHRFGVTKCWTRDGFVFVLEASGERHRVSSVAELERLVAQSGSTASAPKPKAAPVKEPAAARSSKRTAAASKK